MARTKKALDAPLDAQSVDLRDVDAADVSVARIVNRLSVDYILRSVRLISEHAGGDLMAGLVLRAIVAANAGYLDQDARTFGQYAALDDAPPDDVRRPVSILAVAGSLGMPYETTRRYVIKLQKAGLVIKVRGGVLAPSSGMLRPMDAETMLANVANLHRLCKSLKRAGFALD
jgi:hypothetical protein